MPKGLKKANFGLDYLEIQWKPEARFGICWGPGCGLLIPLKFGIRGLKKVPGKLLRQDDKKEGLIFSILGFLVTKRIPTIPKKGIAISFQKLTEASRDKYPIRLETGDREVKTS